MDHLSLHNLMVKDTKRPVAKDSAAPQVSRARLAMRSPHIVDLSPSVPDWQLEQEKNPYHRNRFAWFRRLLDQRLHLQDFNARSVSIRERGWRDFPPVEAATMTHAIILTVKRFLDHHPLAELTIISVLHLTFLAVWHLVNPTELNDRSTDTADRILAAPMMLLEPHKKPSETKPAPVSKPSPEKKPFLLPKLPKLSFEFQLGWQASVMGFAVVAMLVVLPVGAYGSLRNEGLSARSIMSTGLNSANSLNEALAAVLTMDFAGANDDFKDAYAGFESVSNGLGSFGKAVSYAASLLPSNSQLSVVSPLMEVGKETSAGGVIITATLSRLKNNPDLEVTEKLRLLSAGLAEALPYFERANDALATISTDAVPEDYRDKITLAKQELPRAVALMREAVPALDFLVPILGGTEPRRYLVVFQNNSELRPTGGFIGSFALVDLRNGEIQALDIPGGGSYDLQGQQTLKVVSPQPLHLINPHWEFQDSNWYPDFPTSAQLITRFYERGGGPTPDGVIAINAGFMERLLESIGPIEMAEYGKTINAQNFFYETQKAVELDYDQEENKPKQFLADMAPKILERLKDMDTSVATKLGSELLDALSSKDVQMWLRSPIEQSSLVSMGWDGGIRSVSGDYLYVVHTNIAGQKTDIMMNDTLHHNAKILADGSVIVTATLTREHHGEKGALFTGVRNVDYARFYVPANAELVSATGFETPDVSLFKIADSGFGAEESLADEEASARFDRDSGTRISREAGKTVFGNWIQTDPGKSSTVNLVYLLPAGSAVSFTQPKTDTWEAKINEMLGHPELPKFSYRLTVQKQSGLNPVDFTSSVEVPAGWQVIDQIPAINYDDRGRYVTQSVLKSDSSFGLVAEAFGN